MVNIMSVVLAFGDSLHIIRNRPDDDTVINIQGRNKGAMKEVRQVLKLRNLWIISLFYFLYLGVAFAAGGKNGLIFAP